MNVTEVTTIHCKLYGETQLSAPNDKWKGSLSIIGKYICQFDSELKRDIFESKHLDRALQKGD